MLPQPINDIRPWGLQYFIPMHGMRTVIPQGVNAAVPQKYFKYQFKIRKKGNTLYIDNYLG